MFSIASLSASTKYSHLASMFSILGRELKLNGHHSNRLFLNAKPELDFKYFSNARAFSLQVNAAYHLIVNGAFVAEYETSLLLCFCKRF